MLIHGNDPAGQWFFTVYHGHSQEEEIIFFSATEKQVFLNEEEIKKHMLLIL